MIKFEAKKLPLAHSRLSAPALDSKDGLSKEDILLPEESEALKSTVLRDKDAKP
jgi:hypothetical protein